ncbi:MAG: hypothetical protein AAFQ23_08325 [Cyanobacteria bacterium J06623_1]
MRSHPQKKFLRYLARWGVLAFLLVLLVCILFAAVSLPPAMGQGATADSELLSKQLEFLLQMNSAFLGFLGFVGVLLTWFFKNNLDDAKAVASDMVRRELDTRIKELAEKEFAALERTLLPERIVGESLVDYFVPDGDREAAELAEVRLLEVRGFRKPVRICVSEREVRSRRGDVTVLDLQNWVLRTGQRFVALPAPEREAQAMQLVERLFREILPEAAVLIVYFRGYINNLNKIEPAYSTQYLLIANNPVTLVGHTVNGAYVAYGDRRSSH